MLLALRNETEFDIRIPRMLRTCIDRNIGHYIIGMLFVNETAEQL